MRCAIYARYSTENQRQASINDQIHDCRRHIEREGGTVDESLVFVDAAASGATMHRKGLTKLLRAADAGRFDVLVVEDVSRLSRDTADATGMLRHLDQRGIKIVGVADSKGAPAKGSPPAACPMATGASLPATITDGWSASAY